MQTSNNYDKGVFNGEMGQIILVDNEAKRFTVQFDIASSNTSNRKPTSSSWPTPSPSISHRAANSRW